MHGDVLVEQLEVEILDYFGGIQRGNKINGTHVVALDKIFEFIDVAEYRGILAGVANRLGRNGSFASLDLHAADYLGLHPWIGGNFLVQEVG
jgi:hypothetical protein